MRGKLGPQLQNLSREVAIIKSSFCWKEEVYTFEMSLFLADLVLTQ